MMNFIFLIFVVSSFACSKPAESLVNPASQSEMKKIVYRGGLVEFSIPKNWKEEYGDEGGGEFYDKDGNSGTLRLNVLAFDATKPTRIDADSAAKDAATEFNGEIVRLREGNVMVRYERDDTENGKPVKLRFWDVFSLIENKRMRIFVFSYALPSAKFNDERHVKEMEMIEREIRNALFANTLGTVQ